MESSSPWENETSGLYEQEVTSCVEDVLDVSVHQVQTFNGRSANDIYRVHTDASEYIVKIFSYPYMEPGMARGAGRVQRWLAEETNIVPENYFIGEYGEIPYVLHISEFVSGSTIPHGWRELFSDDRQREEIRRAGRIVSILQEAKTFESSGEVVGFDADSGLQMRANSWEQTIKQIFNRRRDHAYEVGLLDENVLDSFIETVEPIVDSWVVSFSESVLCHNDIRLPNIVVPTGDSLGYVVDWDNVAVGDWVFGFSRVEYTVSNKASSSSTVSREEAKTAFREAFFDASDTHSSLPQRYYVYRALSVLQELRSFEYWYQNESDTFKDQQRDWLVTEINRLQAEIQNIEL